MVFTAKSPKINIEEVRALSKLEGQALERKSQRDQELEAIIRGENQRILLVIGPCSSDNEEAVLEYAKRLAVLQEEVADRIFMVMRVYTAKPRTNGDGYKGLIHQPNATEAPSLINGIKAVRHLHYRVITETGMTTADEMLYPENLPLVDDLILTWRLVPVRLKTSNIALWPVGQISRLVLKIQPLEISMLCLMGFMLLKTNKVSFS